MLGILKDSIFSEQGKILSARNMNSHTTIPFHDHPQFPLLIDILSRKDTHHVALVSDFKEKMQIAFLESLAQQLRQENTPHTLHNMEFIYLDISCFTYLDKTKEEIARDFHALHEKLFQAKKGIVFAINHVELLFGNHPPISLVEIKNQLLPILTHEKWRLIVFIEQDVLAAYHKNLLLEFFFTLPLTKPSEFDSLCLLQQHRIDLENFHHINIPEEILWDAYSLVQRYLSHTHPFDKALLLLDSCAARASTIDQGETPTLSREMLIHMISQWTKIGLTQLTSHKFKLHEFNQKMQHYLFGQEAAITLIGHVLQKAHLQLQVKSGPLCSFLFAGPPHTGKKTAAFILAEHALQQPHAVFYVQFQTSFTPDALTEMKVKRLADGQYLPLFEVIDKTPYAILVFDRLEEASSSLLKTFAELHTSGFFYDGSGREWDFRHTILIFTTTWGSRRLLDLAQTTEQTRDTPYTDLSDLMLQEHHHATTMAHAFPAQELSNEIAGEIFPHLPSDFSHHVAIIPFVPLDKLALEKIIQVKLKILAKRLEARYTIELGYLPEVVHYLATEVFARQEKEGPFIQRNKVMKELLDSCIEQALLAQLENKHRPKNLFLQLNDTGELLRAVWLANKTRQPTE